MRPRAGERDLVWNLERDHAAEPVAPGFFIWRVIADATSESRLVRLSPG